MTDWRAVLRHWPALLLLSALGMSGYTLLLYGALGFTSAMNASLITAANPAGTPNRVGFVPQSRILVTAAEWVLEGGKIALEYSHDWDYPVSKGGTGKQANGFFLDLTYVW